MKSVKPDLYTSLSPALLHLYDVSRSIVVIIDVLRATSTIATVLYNGAKHIISVVKGVEGLQSQKRKKGGKDKWSLKHKKNDEKVKMCKF